MITITFFIYIQIRFIDIFILKPDIGFIVYIIGIVMSRASGSTSRGAC